MHLDLNADLGEGMGDDAAMLGLVTSANVACGGHASDPDLMLETLLLAKARGVTIGAHPGYPDRANFGRVVVPMEPAQISSMVAAQIGALQGVARLCGARVAYVKAHGALANLAADRREVADAVAGPPRPPDWPCWRFPAPSCRRPERRPASRPLPRSSPIAPIFPPGALCPAATRRR